MVLGWGKKTVSKQQDEEEMTMDEILASIRRYVADEPSSPPPIDPPSAPRLRPRDREREEPSSASMEREFFPSEAKDNSSFSSQTSRSSSDSAPPPSSLAPSPPQQEESVMSPETFSATAGAFSRLEKEETRLKEEKNLSSTTLEALMIRLLTPMIREWLDQNLPQRVEAMIQKEIDRMRNT